MNPNMKALKELCEAGDAAHQHKLEFDGSRHIWHDAEGNGSIWMTADIAPCDCDIEPEDAALGEFFAQAANSRPAIKYAIARIEELEAALATSDDSNKKMMVQYNTQARMVGHQITMIKAAREGSKARIQTLEAALREIEDAPDMGGDEAQWMIDIARKALAQD